MKYFSLLFLVVVPFFSKGQFVSLALSGGVPQNEFSQNTDAIGFGGDLSFGMPFQRDLPIYVGLDFNYMIYGLNTENQNLEANVTTSNGTVLSSFDIPLRVVNTSSLFGTHAFMRAALPFDLVQPYVEGLVGFRYISTTTRIEDRSPDGRFSDDDDDNIIARNTVLDDWIFSYGYGGGFMIRLGDNAHLDLRANFFKGQKAEFFDGNDTESWTVEFNGVPDTFDENNINSGDLDYQAEPKESRTDLLVIKLGLAFKI